MVSFRTHNKTTMELPQHPVGRSNAASAVGRRVSVTINDKDNGPSLDGIVVAFDPNANTHTIKFDNGSTKALILNCTKFNWIVEDGEAADSKGGRLSRLRMAMRDLVGRKLRILHKGRGEWFHGTIVGFCEQSDKHKIKFESLKKERDCDLKKRKFRSTDLIGPRSPSAPHALSTSRYMGVLRNAEQSWVALKATRMQAISVHLNLRRMLRYHMMSTHEKRVDQ
jgi:hypothetical protein